MRAQLSPGAVRCPQSSVVLSSSSSPSEHLREPSSSRAGNNKKDTRCAASGKAVGGTMKGSISAMERSSALVLGRPGSVASARGCWAWLASVISKWLHPKSTQSRVMLEVSRVLAGGRKPVAPACGKNSRDYRCRLQRLGRRGGRPLALVSQCLWEGSARSTDPESTS